MVIKHTFFIKHLLIASFFMLFISSLFAQDTDATKEDLSLEKESASEIVNNGDVSDQLLSNEDKDAIPKEVKNPTDTTKKTKHKKPSYSFTTLENGEVEFKQYLEWEGLFGVLFYELTVKERGSENIVIDRLKLEENHVELTLKPGRYEYKVDAYNMLNHKESSSEWAKINVKQAHKPKINSVRPHIVWIEDEVWNLHVSGKDFAEDCEVLFISDGVLKKTIQLKPEKKTNRSISFHFKNPEAFLGPPYRIKIIDKSGITESSDQFFIKYKRPFSVYFGIGYAPIAPFGDAFYKTHWIKPMYPLAFTGTVGFIFSRQSYGYFGISSNNTFRSINLKEEDVTLKNYAFISTINFVYEWWFHRKFSLYISPGFGFAVNTLKFMYQDGFDESASFVDPVYSIGAGVRMKVHRLLYLDFVLRLEQILNKETKPFMFTPEISFGFRY